MSLEQFEDGQSWAAIGVKPDPDTWLPKLTLFVTLQDTEVLTEECDDCGGDHAAIAALHLTPDAAVSAGLELIKSAQMVIKLSESLESKTLDERKEIINLYAQFNADDLGPLGPQ